ncbi:MULTISPECIES: hypothetical protein [Paenibacillus]|uniref:Uncharacterized protein n=1 Tax=Paenibacillus woosongensis TaxID=307580 RepID=A0A7X2Z1J5_9BACL|nr:hypothetical protein [Paenibacillus woosongensis]MUG45891.1 hypothetical protein [Paenibacillus woosongensis]
MAKSTIKIKGILSRPIFRNASFSGQIIFDKYEFTKTYDLIDIVFYKHINPHMGAMVYTTVKNGEPILELFGTVYISGDFDKVAFSLSEKHGVEPNTKISAPAENYDDALSISKIFTVDDNKSN